MASPYTEVGGDDVLLGSVVADRYHVAGVLGQGTTGTVFGVEHIHFGRRAAMKVLRPRSANADLVHRVFHGDARAAWSVSHPCIVDIFDVGTLPDGAPFFVTEYLEGETLAKRMARDRLSLAAAVDVMMQLLSAIEAVHARALLVRDLRPQNIFLSNRRGCRPVVKILDLGLARLTPLEAIAEQWEADPPAAAASFPHPFYLSPERTRSEHGVEPASDLFVAAVIFYEMLTGSRPFAAPSYNGLLLAIAQANPTPVSELRDHALADLDAFVARGLAGNPRNRPPSAKEMQDELRRIFEGARRSGTSTSVHATNTSPPSASSSSHAHAHAQSQSHAPSHGHSHATDPPATSAVGAPGSLPPLASMLEPVPSTPRDQTLATEAPHIGRTDRPDMGPDFDSDEYADERETNRKYVDLEPFRNPASNARTNATKSRFDEASAENPHKTVRPQPAPGLPQPPTMEFKASPIANALFGATDFEPENEEPTESRNAIFDPELASIRAQNETPPPPILEEETQTMQLTPELRARIDAQQEAARRAREAQAGHHPHSSQRSAAHSESDSIPPPTKRLDK